MLLGNPLSGLARGPHWLPNGWATLGQLLPPGASGSLLRANAFFDGTGVAAPHSLWAAGSRSASSCSWFPAGAASARPPQKSRPPKPRSSPAPDQHGYDEGVGLIGARPLPNCTLEESTSER